MYTPRGGGSPGMPLVAVFVTNSDPLPDTRQVFENQCLARLNGFVYQGFAYLVIQPLSENASHVQRASASDVSQSEYQRVATLCGVCGSVYGTSWTFAPLKD